ncbi:hypothetical protein P7C70_g1581, partial [Phenoliferia sp. Uapishka_3]
MKTFMIRGAPVGAIAILLAVFASVGGFIFGYDTGQISDFQVMDDFKRRFASCTDRSDASTCHFSNVRTGLIVAMLSIGCLFGALVGASIADRVGRRRAISINCGIIIIGSLIQVTSFHSWVQFMIARIITGVISLLNHSLQPFPQRLRFFQVGIGALSAVVPLYQAETAPKEIRGSLVATYQLFITFGILMAYCIAIGTRPLKHSAASGSWRVVLALNMLWALILGCGIYFAPESPRWLMANGYPEKCEAALARIRGVQVADNDFTVRQSYFEIQEAVRQEEAMDKFTWLECFQRKDMILYRTLLMMLLQSLQQLTGVCTFGGVYIVERFGRRVPLIVGGCWQSVWLFVFAAGGTAQDPETSQGMGNLLICSACFFIAGYAMTWAPCIWILVGETFPTRSRAKQGALATGSNWIWNFLIGFFTSFITGDIHYRYGFIFAACNLFGAAVVYFFVYESSGLSLEAVDQMYNVRCHFLNLSAHPSTDTASRFPRTPSESRADYQQALEAEKKASALRTVQHRELAEDGSHSSHSDHAAEKRAPLTS